MTPTGRNTVSGDALQGLVVATYRRHYAVTLPDGETLECVLTGRSLQIACGDRVDIVRMAGGGAIESVAPRTSLLYRSDAFREKLIAANVTQIMGGLGITPTHDLLIAGTWETGAGTSEVFSLEVTRVHCP